MSNSIFVPFVSHQQLIPVLIRDHCNNPISENTSKGVFSMSIEELYTHVID